VDEFCYQHAGKAKASNCFDCMRPICVACVKLHGSHDYCPECSAAIGAKQLKRASCSVPSRQACVDGEPIARFRPLHRPSQPK
jgi:hypothetical protein